MLKHGEWVGAVISVLSVKLHRYTVQHHSNVSVRAVGWSTINLGG